MRADSASRSGLVLTRLGVPRVGQRLVDRERIYRKLDMSLNRRLTMVTAPAGYGKSAAVSGWLAARRVPAAWASLAADDTPDVFWRYIYAACGSACDAIAGVSPAAGAAHASALLINALVGVADPICIVLDDFRFVTNTEILLELAYLIDYLPSTAHLMLICRREPSLSLGRIAVDENLLRIGVEDLRFRHHEIADFFAKRGQTLSHGDVQTIARETEGWAAALAAQAVSLQDAEPDGAVGPAAEYCAILDQYLDAEVASEWTEEQRDFLLATSVLRRLCGALCTAVTGLDSAAMLRENAERNGFLAPLDADHTWYRYHAAYSGYLRRRLVTERDEAATEVLYERAAVWFQANGFTNEAIENYLAARRYAAAIPLIDRQGASLAKRGQYASFLSWTARLPAELVDQAPGIVAVQAAYYAEIGDYRSAWNRMARLEAFTNASPPGFARSTYLGLKANLHIRQGDVSGLIESIKAASALDEPDSEFHNGYMDVNVLDICFHRSPAHQLFGLMAQSPDAYWDFVKTYRSLTPVDPGFAPLLAGEFYYEAGRLEKSLPYLLCSLEEALKAKCGGALVPAVAAIARIRRAQGDEREAFAIVAEYSGRLDGFVNATHWRRQLRAFQARLDLDAGDLGKASEWLAGGELGIYQGITRATEYEYLVFARVLIEQNRWGEAETLLQRLLMHADGLGRPHSVVEILILLSINAKRRGARASARRHLGRALTLGRAEGYLRIFADEGQRIEPLLAELTCQSPIETSDAASEGLVSYAREILTEVRRDRLRAEAGPAHGETADILLLLTPRERVVLHFLLNALSNREIADRLGVTVRTVKAHTTSIYMKLGVKSRAQCVKAARDLAFL